MREDPNDDHSERLRQAASRAASLRREIAADPSMAEAVAAVKRFQSERLAKTHADLLAQPRYAAAARFFLEDLYGEKDFSRRDAELARVTPSLSRFLPEAALCTVADAVELDALSESLDIAIARRLRAGALRPLGTEDYVKAYAAVDRTTDRERQIELIVHIGRALDRLVRSRLVGSMLGAMGVAARAAGLATMHEFLVRGFEAFRSMDGAGEFLERIASRERALMNAWLGGRLVDPESPSFARPDALL